MTSSKISPTDQAYSSPQDPIGKGSRKLSPSKRQSKLLGQHVGRDVATLPKIDLQAPKLITTQAVTKDDELERRLDRINDIGNMLAENGALSKAERQWLRNLHNTDKKSYNKIGKLLSVPKYFSFRESRVKNLEDRNKIRMQTLKAVVFEALKTADKDTTAEKKKQAIDRALEKATAVRWALNQKFPRYADSLRRLMGRMHRGQTELRKAMTQKFGDREVKLYEVVSTTTLRDPDRLYGPYSRGLANDNLSRAVAPSGEIDPKIKKRHVDKAVNTLVKNGLLNQRAATDLLDALQNMPENVNTLMSHADEWVRRSADREKVKSLMLLALAYEFPHDEASSRRLQKKIHTLLIHWRSDGKRAKPDVNDRLEVRRGYRWLPDFPYSNTLNELDHNRLLSWATTAGIKIEPDAIENEVKIDDKAEIPLYEADPPPPTIDDDEAAPPPDPSDSKDDITQPSAIFNSVNFGSVEPKAEEPLIDGRTLEDWLLDDMSIDESILKAAKEQGGIEREDKNPDSNDLKTP